MSLIRHTDMLSSTIDNIMDQTEWQNLSPDEKRIRLYLKQKALLEQFLQTGAISKVQYDKSLGDLTEKMGMKRYG